MVRYTDHEPIASSTTSTSAADTLSMLTQSMLGNMPSAVATAAAAGLFMRVNGGGNGAPDNGSPGKKFEQFYYISMDRYQMHRGKEHSNSFELIFFTRHSTPAFRFSWRRFVRFQ